MGQGRRTCGPGRDASPSLLAALDAAGIVGMGHSKHFKKSEGRGDSVSIDKQQGELWGSHSILILTKAPSLSLGLDLFIRN